MLTLAPLLAASHIPSSTMLPFDATHLTLRLALPYKSPTPQLNPPESSAVNATQLLHDDVHHTYTSDGHANKLHALDVAGRATPDDTHTESSTGKAMTLPLPPTTDVMHTASGGDAIVVTPGA